MSEVENKLVEMLDAIQNGAVKVGEQVVKYSPDVADAALWVVRIDGIQAILMALYFIPAGVLFMRLAIKFYAKCQKEGWETEPPIVGVGALWLVSGMFFAHAAVIIFTVWNWVAIFEPKLWLAKQIIETVIPGK